MAAQTNFIDIATIWLHAGKGGDGAVSFPVKNSGPLSARTAAIAAGAAISSLGVRSPDHPDGFPL